MSLRVLKNTKVTLVNQQKCLIHLTNNVQDLPLSLEGYKRGTGGRSSFSGKVATVFGATGIMGRIIVNRLGKQGSQVIVPHRCDEMLVRPLKLCGDLGQIVFQPLDLRNEDTIRNAIKYSNIVVNCLGTNWETSNWKFEDVHIKAAQTIAKISRECNVEKLVHFSALNASPDPQKIYSKVGSKFLRTKYEGELAVQSEFPQAFIIRPSTIYGEQDNFLYLYTNPLRRGIKSIGLWNKGEKTIKQPVHQYDVATGVMKLLNDHGKPGHIYDFVGPKRYLLSELVDYIMSILRRQYIKRSNMSAQYLLTCYAFEKIFKKQVFNLDLLERVSS